jgi:hypothetical protein
MCSPYTLNVALCGLMAVPVVQDSFEDDVIVNGVQLHTLWVTDDNDFDAGMPNNFYVFGIGLADLPTYQAQAPVPKPQTVALLAAGLGLMVFRSRRKRGR